MFRNDIVNYDLGGSSQEKTGIRQLLSSDLIPTKLYPNDLDLDRVSVAISLNAWGFEIGNQIDIFWECKLPSGWSKEILNDRYIRILNNHGILRLIYYYCIRDAHFRIVPRYEVLSPPFSGVMGRMVVVDNSFVSPKLVFIDDSDSDSNHRHSKLLCEKWLDMNHPLWRDCTAYWEVDCGKD